mmetsp:Transcript_31338/g.69756  ORF Transcript_31338/g.69756 Transcript_31338/m.69756 type:complete len:247 (-) Transcript_31338:1537-2277(-)
MSLCRCLYSASTLALPHTMPSASSILEAARASTAAMSRGSEVSRVCRGSPGEWGASDWAWSLAAFAACLSRFTMTSSLPTTTSASSRAFCRASLLASSAAACISASFTPSSAVLAACMAAHSPPAAATPATPSLCSLLNRSLIWAVSCGSLLRGSGLALCVFSSLCLAWSSLLRSARLLRACEIWLTAFFLSSSARFMRSMRERPSASRATRRCSSWSCSPLSCCSSCCSRAISASRLSGALPASR